jgi:hypothetical protein
VKIDTLLNLPTVLLFAIAILLAVDRWMLGGGTTTRSLEAVEAELIGRRLPTALVDPATYGADDFGLAFERLVVVFHTSCPACFRTRPAWRRIVAVGLRTMAVTTEPDTRASDYFGTDSIVVRGMVDGRSLRAMGIDKVPTTLLIGADGTILQAHIGVLDDRDMQKLVGSH